MQDQVHDSGDPERGAALPQATITPEMIASMRSRIGQQLRIGHSVHNEIATPLAITRFCEGIGDPNPLWLEPGYAADGPFGQIVGPPSWVICAFSGIQFGWPGLGSFHSASELEFMLPVREADHITPSCVYEGFDGPRPSRFAERVVTDRFRNHYHNQDSELVAAIRWWVVNYERGKVRPRPAGTAVQQEPIPQQWTEAELRQIDDQVRAERPRGRSPRWWDDVQVGDPIGPLLKGPIGMTDEIAFLAGGGAPIPRLAAHHSALLQYERHPSWAFRDPVSSAWEPIYAVHYNKAAAMAMGVVVPYDVGFQRQCWQIHLLTDWMGDDGWLQRCSARYRDFVYHGDVVRLSGQVADKSIDAGGHAVVDIETCAVNQRGTDVMPGTARIALPRRGHDRSPAASYARRATPPSSCFYDGR